MSIDFVGHAVPLYHQVVVFSHRCQHAHLCGYLTGHHAPCIPPDPTKQIDFIVFGDDLLDNVLRLPRGRLRHF